MMLEMNSCVSEGLLCCCSQLFSVSSFGLLSYLVYYYLGKVLWEKNDYLHCIVKCCTWAQYLFIHHLHCESNTSGAALFLWSHCGARHICPITSLPLSPEMLINFCFGWEWGTPRSRKLAKVMPNFLDLEGARFSTETKINQHVSWHQPIVVI